MTTTLPFKPINALEKKIMSDKEFLHAIQAGRVRQWHNEGTIKNHIINMLKYIDAHYKKNPEYEHLRIIAILHDIGKLARLHNHPENYLPDGTKAQQRKLIIASKKFSEKYVIPPAATKKIEPYKFTHHHAYISYLFAKKFLKDKRILEIIKYHDIAFDFKKIITQKNTYDIREFKRVFSRLDINLYILFFECDRYTDTDSITSWFKKQLTLHKISKFK